VDTAAGSAAQIGRAFHTEIHLYKVNGETHYAHYANASNPSVPAAMSKVVAAIRGLHDFRMKPKVQKVVALGGTGQLTPAYTNSKGEHYLAPDDFATIFNLNSLYNSGINGSGQQIVIVGQSQIDTTHLSTFTSYFGMNSVSLQTVLVPNKQSPGYSVTDAQESDLDLQWSAAVARGASLILVYSYDVLDAVQYAIDQNLAPVISMSYGECEESGTKSDAATRPPRAPGYRGLLPPGAKIHRRFSGIYGRG
jgi:subtilase family serine protease